ncbi:hypothetical protein QIL71_gp2 [ssRNA phage SRR7976310_10]|uniref:Uncharacterized protein n=1 Tax=ssRNA phage SRR7976310_10 TaxID=2786672 RepID=A0A8S5L4S7_9VIRU|nr:hypothetical protein QIL71_gp2 [ssRNA phage SRR7976310_10]DAD52710.1 TPA_asm: hypothetical protein [ssRNA phage SRR7976310_10]
MDKPLIRSDDVLRLKIIILIVYMVCSVGLIVWTGSDQLLIDQLTLQLGDVVKTLLPQLMR